MRAFDDMVDDEGVEDKNVKECGNEMVDNEKVC